MRSHRGLLAFALSTSFGAVVSTGAVPSAEAAECAPTAGLHGCVDSDNLWMNAGSTTFFSLGPGATVPAGKLSFGLGLTYLSQPIGLVTGSSAPGGSTVWAVDNAVNATFLWAFGVTDRLQLTAVAPTTLFQDGAGLYTVLGSDAELPRGGIRDLRFGFDASLIAHPRTGLGDGLSLVGRFQLALPTGQKDALAGSKTITWVPSVLAEYVIVRPTAGTFSRVTIAAEAGARVRGATSLAGSTVGSQIQTSIGVNVEILPKYLSAGAEAFALFGVDEQSGDARPSGSTAPLMPAEWILSVSSAPLLGGDLSASLGGGGPIPFAADPPVTAPRFRFELALRYAPSGRDGDGDGVLDKDDKCPNAMEDRDGFQDDDGCPELDNDRDGIPDDRDRCRDDAETVDGFQDEDGCPDLDDDNDGIPDEVDQCRNEPEDIDSFQDEDGCPDPDNDLDGIPDNVDLCINGAEDFDGFKDKDGCPDPDNDLDNVPDDQDDCPLEPEDRDGFKDDDGCPDPDNDEDGVLDKDDACATSPETIDGNADGDGCPEPEAKSLVKWQGNQAVLDPGASFAPGSAKPSADLEKRLAMLAQLVRGASPVLIIIEGYADRQGDTSAKAADLADKRSLAIKAAFVAVGIPESIITAASGDPSVKRAPGTPAFDVTVRRPKPKPRKKPAPAAPPEKP